MLLRGKVGVARVGTNESEVIMLNRYTNLINILNELKSNNPNVPKLRADLRFEIEDGNIHEFEFVELMEKILQNLRNDSTINMELVENLLKEVEREQKKENDYEDQISNPMHVDCDYVAWNYKEIKHVMISLLKKRTIRKAEAEMFNNSIKAIVNSKQIPADIIIMITDLVGEFGLIYGVAKTNDEMTMIKRMAELRCKCKDILRAVKASEEFDAEFGIEWH